MIIAQTYFEMFSTMVYSSRLVAYNDIKDIPVDECSDGCVKLTFKEDLDDVANFFKWKINKSKMSNITDLITKVIQISEVNVNQKLSFKTMYYTEDFGWITGKEVKSIWKNRNK